jgi:hypothetical protein
MPGSRQRLPLTLEMFEWMVRERPHLIPDLSREYIEDKSKSDCLAKGLTCWQAGYFCIQCTSRLSQCLSIALLELNVFAHAICALLLFLVWWDKPRDVSEPTLILSDEALDVCACLWHNDHNFKSKTFNLGCDSPPLDKYLEIARPTIVTGRTLRLNREHAFVQMPDSELPHDRMIPTIRFMADPNECNKYDFLKVLDTYWQIQSGSRNRVRDVIDMEKDITITLTDRGIRRLMRVYRSVQKDPSLSWSIQPLRNPSTICFLHAHELPCFHNLSVPISNWSIVKGYPSGFLIKESFADLCQAEFGWLLAGLTSAGACYGGLHLVAWTSTFASLTETVMWRAASVTVVLTGPSYTIIAICASGFAWLDARSNVLADLHIIFCGFLILSTLLWYTLCRASLVVECFIHLAHIPESALHVPSWATYIPSFT